MKKLKYISLIGLLSIIFLFGLGTYYYKNHYLIQEEKMGLILAHLHSLKNNTKSEKIKYTAKILKIYNITPKQLEKSINYYSSNSKKLIKVYKNSLDNILLLEAMSKQF
ncbi:MAG: DUF4296 domain-containing protein [Bacteroidetes bacterium]|nr:DUF4296 domain-containing protein [Bacteroidota bacterium]